MGNRISVAQDERDEAEYKDLVRAVEIAQQRAGAGFDPEAGFGRLRCSYCRPEHQPGGATGLRFGETGIAGDGTQGSSGRPYPVSGPAHFPPPYSPHGCVADCIEPITIPVPRTPQTDASTDYGHGATGSLCSSPVQPIIIRTGSPYLQSDRPYEHALPRNAEGGCNVPPQTFERPVCSSPESNFYPRSPPVVCGGALTGQPIPGPPVLVFHNPPPRSPLPAHPIIGRPDSPSSSRSGSPGYANPLPKVIRFPSPRTPSLREVQVRRVPSPITVAMIPPPCCVIPTEPCLPMSMPPPCALPRILNNDIVVPTLGSKETASADPQSSGAIRPSGPSPREINIPPSPVIIAPQPLLALHLVFQPFSDALIQARPHVAHRLSLSRRNVTPAILGLHQRLLIDHILFQRLIRLRHLADALVLSP
ncbi:hypothetical protein NM688_g3124 [Phlebia brevispora]|uniref:Uncharacterized protein n=1 Tax=Phlebia brevispora TaxID=194682 RepID=A0ACC1T7B8_9APHY|nr:hypothetical protein NM688_g3124 [Phlebia brevispora]